MATTTGQLTASTDAPGMPACAAADHSGIRTYPPGNGYGVPFLAAITNGQVLAGYDEWTANHLIWKVGRKTTTTSTRGSPRSTTSRDG